MQRREGACEKEPVKTYFQALWLLTLMMMMMMMMMMK